MNMWLLGFMHFCEVIHEFFLAGLITACPPGHIQAFTLALGKILLPSIYVYTIVEGITCNMFI